jgi:hypothetical protein
MWMAGTCSPGRRDVYTALIEMLAPFLDDELRK